jgi:hypothetical protein
MLRDVEMNYAAPAVSQDHQPKQDSKGSRGDSEEIHRNQVIGMIVEEGLPGLGRQFRLLRKQPRHGALRDRNSQFWEFP